MKLLFVLFNLSEELDVVVCNCNDVFQSVQCISGEFSVKKIAFCLFFGSNFYVCEYWCYFSIMLFCLDAIN